MRRALDSQIERIGEQEGENDSSNMSFSSWTHQKEFVADGALTGNGLFLIQNSYKDYTI
jgi:hypothetical protein